LLKAKSGRETSLMSLSVLNNKPKEAKQK